MFGGAFQVIRVHDEGPRTAIRVLADHCVAECVQQAYDVRRLPNPYRYSSQVAVDSVVEFYS